MRRALACIAVVALLPGCAAWTALQFSPDPSSGKTFENAKIEMKLLYKLGDPRELQSLIPLPAMDDAKVLESLQCGGPLSAKQKEDPANKRVGVTALIGGVTVVFIGALAEYAFNQLVDWALDKVEQLAKDASPDAYVVRAVMPSDAFRNASCIAVTRGHNKTKGAATEVDLLAIWRIDHHTGIGEGFTLAPVYFRAIDSIAKAAPPSVPDAFPHMNLGMAMSLRMIGVPPSTLLPVAHTLGPAEAPFADVAFGCRAVGPSPRCAPATMSCRHADDDCKRSELAPLPPPGVTVSLAVSLTEQGDVGLDFELAKAQLKALRELLGPTAKSMIDARFGD